MLALLLFLSLGAPEDKEEKPSYETVVRDKQDGGIETQRRIDATHPGFATAIDLEQEAGARSADALPEVLARTPGATVRSIGGLGQYSSISLRGSSPQQVAIFLDGVPVTNGIAGLVSLSDFPLDTLGRVEVYRGYVPVYFGSAAIGGAVNLVSSVYRGPARGAVVADWGSFGAHGLAARYSQPLGHDHSFTARLGYSAARGDFPFYDTQGTPVVHGDDTISIRNNNGYHRLLGQLRLDGQQGGWRYSVQQLTLVKHQAVPAPAATQPVALLGAPALDTLSLKLIGAARRSVFGAGGRFGLAFGASLDRVHFVDFQNVFGTNDTDSTTTGVDLFAAPRLRIPLWSHAFLTATVDVRLEHQTIANAVTTPGNTGNAERVRGTYGAGMQLEQFLFANRLQLVPVVRIDFADSHFAVPAGEGEVLDAGRDQVSWEVSPRGALRFTIIEGLQIRSSFGRFFRPPTVLELFGDRGYLTGNEGLVPESGLALDGGVVADLSLVLLDLYLHVAGFATWADDLIIWDQVGRQIRPINLAGAELAGLESSLITRWLGDRVRLHANYTYLETRNGSPEASQHGQPLPGRARHELFGRISLGEKVTVAPGRAEGRLFYNLDYLSGTFLDTSGQNQLPPRAIHGLGAEVTLWPKVAHRLKIRFAVEVRNLADTISMVLRPDIAGARPQRRPLVDFIGYPLPGRSFWVSLAVSGPAPREETDAS